MRAYFEPEYAGDSVHAIGFVEAGWESSRRELEEFERIGEISSGIFGALIGESAVPAPEENQALALDRLSPASDIARLARNIGEMSGVPGQPLKQKLFMGASGLPVRSGMTASRVKGCICLEKADNNQIDGRGSNGYKHHCQWAKGKQG